MAWGYFKNCSKVNGVKQATIEAIVKSKATRQGANILM
jgi:hypothetical protein